MVVVILDTCTGPNLLPKAEAHLGKDCPSNKLGQKGDWRGRVSFTRAECLNVDRRTPLIMTPKRSPHVLRFLPGVGELLLSFDVPSQVLVRKTFKAALRESPSLRNTLKLTIQKSPGPSGTLMALLRMQFGMEGQESTPSTQEAKKTKLASLPAYTPQTTKLKQKPWKQQQLILKPALMLPPMLSSLRTPCPSCRPSSQIGTQNSMTCLLLLPHFVDAMQSPYNGYHRTANLPGNEAADSLAKEGTTKEQVDRSTSYPEVKTILKAKQHSKWGHKHPRYNKADPYYLLTRREQVTVFRLRTGHNRLNYHLYSELHIGHTEQCPCGTGSQATEHLLQFCPTYKPLRKGIWPDHTPVARKLYGSLRDLRCTATFIGETGVSIWRTRRRRNKHANLSKVYLRTVCLRYERSLLKSGVSLMLSELIICS